MADVLHRVTKRLLRSVNDPDYPTEDWIHNPDLSAVAGVPAERWVIEGDTVRAMTEAEALPLAKATRVRALAAAVRDYADAHYPDREELRWRYRQAVDAGLTNRAALAQEALTWGDLVLLDYAQRAATLDAATTLAAVEAVSLDFGNHDATDPLVSVRAVMMVPD